MKVKRNWVDSVVESIPEGYEWIAESLVTAMNNNTLTELQRHGVALIASILSNNGELAFEICMNSPLFGTPERELAKKCAVIMEINRLDNRQSLVDKIDNDKTSKIFLQAARKMTTNSMESNVLAEQEYDNIRSICAVVSVMNKIII